MAGRWRMAAVAMAVFVMTPTLATAQKPFDVNAGAVVMAPLSDSADRFTLGYGWDVGLTWNMPGPFGIRFDYVRSGIESKDEWVSHLGAPLGVSGRIQFGTAALLFQAPPGLARIYVLAGGGIYRREVTITASGAGNAVVCDPWWFVCGTQAVPVAKVAGTRSTTDFGVNVGAGVAFGRLFVEGRYHFMWGPKYETAEGTVSATGKYFPLTVGVIF